jgi:hypothetical protein
MLLGAQAKKFVAWMSTVQRGKNSSFASDLKESCEYDSEQRRIQKFTIVVIFILRNTELVS